MMWESNSTELVFHLVNDHSSPIISSPESYHNENYVESALKQKNTDVKSLSDDWITHYFKNPSAAIRELVNTIFHTTGWLNFNFTNQTFEEPELQEEVHSKGHMVSDPDALNKDYISLYSQFMSNIFSNTSILLGTDIPQLIIKIINLIITGNYDSYRIVGFFTGSKLLWAIIKYKHYLEEVCVNEANVSSVEVTLNTYWNELYSHLFGKCTRDGSSYIRGILCCELRNWSKDCPKQTLNLISTKYLCRCFMLKKLEHREIAYQVVFNLLKIKLNVEKQDALFRYIKSELMTNIQQGGNLGVVAMEVLVAVSSYLKLEFTTNEIETIFISVYCDDRRIGIQAAQLTFRMKLSHYMDRPVEFIFEIARFSLEAYIQSSEDLLVDSWSLILNKITTWENWKDALKESSPHYTESIANVLFAYVRNETTNYKPKSRTKYHNYGKHPDYKAAKLNFIEYFKTAWFDIIGFAQVKFQPEALSQIILLIQFFGKPLPAETLVILGYQLKTFCLISQAKPVIEACGQMLGHLEKLLIEEYDEDLCSFNEIKSQLMSSIVNDYIEYIKLPESTTNVEIIHWKVSSTFGFISFDDESVWEVTLLKLSEFTASGYFRKNTHLMYTMMCALIDLLFRHFNQLYDLNEMKKKNVDKCDGDSLGYSDNSEKELDDQMNEIILLLFPRICEIEIAFLPLLKTDIPCLIRNKAFFGLARLYENFGPQMFEHDGFFPLAICFNNNYCLALLDFTTEHMKINHEAKEHSQDCCRIVKRYSQLCGLGIISISGFGELIRFFGKNSVHDDIVVKGIKQYLEKFPKNYLKLAMTLQYAIVATVHKSLLADSTLEVALAEGKALTHYLGANEMFKKTVNRQIALQLHYLLIQDFIKNNEVQFVQLLHPLHPILHPDDYNYILGMLNELPPSNTSNKDLEHYTTFIRSLTTERTPLPKRSLRDSSESIPAQSYAYSSLSSETPSVAN